MGWVEKVSAAAAMSISSVSLAPGAPMSSVTEKVPSVKVPVLSNTTVSVEPRASR